MKCPKCDKDSTRVIDSRPTDQGLAVRRRRCCDSCDARFTTYERIEERVPFALQGGKREERRIAVPDVDYKETEAIAAKPSLSRQRLAEQAEKYRRYVEQSENPTELEQQ